MGQKNEYFHIISILRASKYEILINIIAPGILQSASWNRLAVISRDIRFLQPNQK